MNRREFTKSLAAASLAPALPLKSLAAAAPAAATDSMYVWADFISRVHNKCSPEMLMRLLKVDASKGHALYSQLMANGAISAPNAYGISQATKPLYQEFATVTGHSAKSAAPASASRKVSLDKLIDEDPQEAEAEEDGAASDEADNTDFTSS